MLNTAKVVVVSSLLFEHEGSYVVSGRFSLRFPENLQLVNMVMDYIVLYVITAL